MKQFALLFVLLLSVCLQAQDDECLDRILAKNGSWKKGMVTNRASQSDYAIQKRFTDVIQSMLASYSPRGVEAHWDLSHLSPVYKQPVAAYRYILRALAYSCSGSNLTLNHEANSKITIAFNNDFARILFDTVADDSGAGFNVLREGFPEEVQPGIWLFRDVPTPLGFGIEGRTNYWLMTYPGELPWRYVTRREFLIKRKQTLLRLLALEAPRYKEQLQKWELQKKQLEPEAKNNPEKWQRFINVDYNPGIEREQQNYERVKREFDKSIEKVEQQLQAAASELDKTAIVIRSSSNHLDYEFTDKMERFAELLVKPNPAYFKKGLAASIPQIIEVALQYYQKDSVSVNFARDIQKHVDLAYLQGCIGKSTPPSFNRGNAAQKDLKAKPSLGKAPEAAKTKGSGAKNNSNAITATSQIGKSSSGNKSYLTGLLAAPAGVPVTISYNNGNDLTITSPKGSDKLYGSTPIRFVKPVSDGETFAVALKKIASNMKGAVYFGKGKSPEDVGKLRIGVDYNYELLTRSSGDKQMSTFYESFAPAIGGYNGEEGRYVVFVSNTKNLESADGKFRQVYWRDRNTGITRLVSVAPTGEHANGDCGEPSVSADGKTVVFESKATNLVSGDNNNVKDIFLWRAGNNAIELISRSKDGGWADAESFDPAIAGNGNFVVFTSTAGNLSSVPKGRSVANIFRRDLQNAGTVMISVDPVHKTGGNGYKASISFDGERVSFCSASGTLVPGDQNDLWDIFLWQEGKNLRRISMTHDGKERNGGSESASRQVASVISGDGKFVAFATTASNMVPNDNNGFQDVFVVDAESGKVAVASFTNEGLPSNGDSPIEQGERVAISFDGTWIAFPTKATNLGAPGSNIILYNRVTRKSLPVTSVTGSYVGRPSMSYSGSYIAFGKSTNLDARFSQAGVFAHFTGNGPCRDCKE